MQIEFIFFTCSAFFAGIFPALLLFGYKVAGIFRSGNDVDFIVFGEFVDLFCLGSSHLFPELFGNIFEGDYITFLFRLK